MRRAYAGISYNKEITFDGVQGDMDLSLISTLPAGFSYNETTITGSPTGNLDEYIYFQLTDDRQVTEADARKFYEDQGYTPTDEEVALSLGISIEEYYKWQDQTKALNLTSLEEHVEQGGESQVKSLSQNRFVQPEEVVEKEALKMVLAEAIGNLSEKEKKVIVLYYYEELTLKEISAVMEVSESRISQLHTKALRKMKEKLGVNLEIFMNA
jgi:RNA polymerase sigma factor for flagellar operon FliA